MNSFFDKVKDLAHRHDDKVDQTLDKAGDEVDERTGGKYTEQIHKGVDAAKEHTGEGDTTKD
ncbi:antitoxin [Dactylosporangium sp. NPDC048998]|uniref:antitoxin n=1 Tax=Dactylosporangium sp. NPDC048998 TaxID=3363976 RepID=UPI00370FEB54